MVITLPKLNAVGKYKMTAVVNAHKVIKGFEPCTIEMNGVKFEGTKVYTDEGKFKVFCSPSQFGQGMMQVLAAASVMEHAVTTGNLDVLNTLAPVEVVPLALPKGKGK